MAEACPAHHGRRRGLDGGDDAGGIGCIGWPARTGAGKRSMCNTGRPHPQNLRAAAWSESISTARGHGEPEKPRALREDSLEIGEETNGGGPR